MADDSDRKAGIQQRIRAAAAAAGYASIAAMVEPLPFSLSSVKRIGDRDGENAWFDDETRLAKIAAACNVPLDWLAYGKGSPIDNTAADAGASSERIAELEAQVEALRKQVMTRKQIEGLIQLRLQAAGLTPAPGEASASRRASSRPAS
jgi:phage repressor protein C with HTH and peptisase S24 domain